MKLADLFVELGFKTDEKSIKEAQKSVDNIVTSCKRIALIGSGAVLAFDRMANSIAKANQKMITFARNTGIALNTLNRYASASASVNYNASPESMAGSLQNVAQNLWDIRMGRGDVSPYQELAFVGGKPINVWGKSVEQVIEELRESLKGVGDIQATNLITRMGFSPDDLLMLRMSKKELAEIQNMFLNPQQQEELNSLSLELKKIHMQFDLMTKRLILDVLPSFLSLMRVVVQIADKLAKMAGAFVKSRFGAMALAFAVGLLATALSVNLVGAIAKVGTALLALVATNPAILALVGALTMLFLLLDDYATAMSGGKSFFNWTGKERNTSEDLMNRGIGAGVGDLTSKVAKRGFIGGILSGNPIFSGLAGGALVGAGFTSALQRFGNTQNNNIVINTTQSGNVARKEVDDRFKFITGQQGVNP